MGTVRLAGGDARAPRLHACLSVAARGAWASLLRPLAADGDPGCQGSVPAWRACERWLGGRYDCGRAVGQHALAGDAGIARAAVRLRPFRAADRLDGTHARLDPRPDSSRSHVVPPAAQLCISAPGELVARRARHGDTREGDVLGKDDQ